MAPGAAARRCAGHAGRVRVGHATSSPTAPAQSREQAMAGRLRADARAAHHPRANSLQGPNLAKADFSAKESQRRQKCPQNQFVMPTHTRTDPVGVRQVRTVHRQRSFEHTGHVDRSKSAVESRQNA